MKQTSQQDDDSKRKQEQRAKRKQDQQGYGTIQGHGTVHAAAAEQNGAVDWEDCVQIGGCGANHMDFVEMGIAPDGKAVPNGSVYVYNTNNDTNDVGQYFPTATEAARWISRNMDPNTEYISADRRRNSNDIGTQPSDRSVFNHLQKALAGQRGHMVYGFRVESTSGELKPKARACGRGKRHPAA